MTEKLPISKEDIQTSFLYCPYHIGKWAEVDTTDKTIMRRYEKFAEQHPDLCTLIREDKYSMTFSADPRCIGLYPKAPRKGRVFTEEEKRANIERLEKARRKKE